MLQLPPSISGLGTFESAAMSESRETEVLESSRTASEFIMIVMIIRGVAMEREGKIKLNTSDTSVK